MHIRQLFRDLFGGSTVIEPTPEPELAALRERAAGGDHDAVDQLVELAGERGDLDELRRLSDQGYSDATDELIQVASELGELDELRRLAQLGNTTAAEQLSELTEQ
jgi:ABC-type hemin transport system substrate-binding protein